MSAKKSTTKKQPSVRITDRDIELFAALSAYRLLSTAQVHSLFTPSYDAAQRLLRRLHRVETVLRVFQPVTRADSAKESVWALARKGAVEVARARECPLPSHLTAKDQRSNLFIDHTLARNDFRICFELLHRSKKLELQTWKQAKEDLYCLGELRGLYNRRERVPLIADGYLKVRHNNKTYYLLLEADMGTVGLKRMARKYKAYWNWWKDGGARKRFGASNIRVLTVTSSYTRLGNLRRLAMQAPNYGRHGSALFWFSTLAQIDPNAPKDVLEKNWWSALVGHDEPCHLFK